MAVDYDIVILGGSAIARYAAWQAARLQARVALVEPEDVTLLESHPLYAMRQAVWMQWATQQSPNPQQLFQQLLSDSPTAEPCDIAQGLEWATNVVDVYAEWRSPARLTAAGVDLIIGQGEFCRRPAWGVMAHGRLLRARAYLLAPPSTMSTRVMRTLDNLDTVDFWTPDSFWMYPPTHLPPRMVMVGGTVRGIEMAQTLARLGVEITLVCDRPTLMPELDTDLNAGLQTLLEATGVSVWTNTHLKSLSAPKPTDPIHLTLAHPSLPPQSLSTDGLVIDAPLEPLLTPLNLEAVDLDPNALTVNDRLQTANPRIYALAPTPNAGDLTVYADLAIHNALFPWTRSLRSVAPLRVLYCDPPLVALGLTEAEAQQRYGNDVVTLVQPFTSLPAAHIRSDLTGVCKLVLRRNGRLLGAHVLGDGSLEMASAIALLIQNHGSIQHLLTLPLPDLSFATVLKQAAYMWQHQQNAHGLRRDLLEGWFEWVRSRTR